MHQYIVSCSVSSLTDPSNFLSRVMLRYCLRTYYINNIMWCTMNLMFPKCCRIYYVQIGLYRYLCWTIWTFHWIFQFVVAAWVNSSHRIVIMYKLYLNTEGEATNVGPGNRDYFNQLISLSSDPKGRLLYIRARNKVWYLLSLYTCTIGLKEKKGKGKKERHTHKKRERGRKREAKGELIFHH